MRAANALVRLYVCTGSSEPSLLACMTSDKLPVLINQIRIYQSLLLHQSYEKESENNKAHKRVASINERIVVYQIEIKGDGNPDDHYILYERS